MTNESVEPVVTVNHLSCRFGRTVALDDVSLAIPRGRVFGLVGENGAGKTTLIKHLLGALSPQSGTVSVLGVDPTRNPPAVLSGIGYLSEDRDLPRWMRVRELMRYTQAFYPNWDNAYAERMLEQFELDAGAKIRNLSRGGKAKAGLLVALAHRPELLLLDEPSSGLDAVARRDILAAVLRSVAEEGRTVVFSSHLLEEVERVADDVAMIHEGRLALSMPMDALRELHQRFVVRFVEPVDAFPEISGVLRSEGDGRDWAVICEGELDVARGALEAVGATIVEHAVPSLETVFVARVRARKPAGIAS